MKVKIIRYQVHQVSILECKLYADWSLLAGRRISKLSMDAMILCKNEDCILLLHIVQRLSKTYLLYCLLQYCQYHQQRGGATTFNGPTKKYGAGGAGEVSSEVRRRKTTETATKLCTKKNIDITQQAASQQPHSQ